MTSLHDERRIANLVQRADFLDDALDTALDRAEKAEQERDYALAELEKADEQVESLYAEAQRYSDAPSELPRPLTADDITDEEQYEEGLQQAGRGQADYLDRLTVWLMGSEWARKRLAPTRPEGAEDIESLIRKACNAGEGADDEQLANYLASNGVRLSKDS